MAIEIGKTYYVFDIYEKTALPVTVIGNYGNQDSFLVDYIKEPPAFSPDVFFRGLLFDSPAACIMYEASKLVEKAISELNRNSKVQP